MKSVVTILVLHSLNNTPMSEVLSGYSKHTIYNKLRLLHSCPSCRTWPNPPGLTQLHICIDGFHYIAMLPAD